MNISRMNAGRPRENGSKNRQYRLRMTDEEFESLEAMSFETGETKSDIIREALRMYGNLHNFRMKNEGGNIGKTRVDGHWDEFINDLPPKVRPNN